MIIRPKVRNYLCLTAHPVGCAAQVERQISYVREKGPVQGAKKALVIGSSTGYGLASRIALAFGCGADTVGVMFEKPSNGKRTASPGWYNDQAFKAAAEKAGLTAITINGDAFSDACKEETIAAVKEHLGSVDMVVYSLAAPRRTDRAGNTWTSVLKPTADVYRGKTLDMGDLSVGLTELSPATPEEVEATVKVMGGEDWMDWIKALYDAGCLSDKAITLAYSYIGPDVTAPIYRDGSIGQAKKHLYRSAEELERLYGGRGLTACVSINKAVVTQASAVIPSVSLYVSILYKLMKERGTHEGCIEQMYRMIADKVYGDGPEGGLKRDENGWIRMDDLEMDPSLQEEIGRIWADISTENVKDFTDLDGFWDDFYQMFGFNTPGIDYDADVAEF